ncbi:hypothetical protein BC830DRAFT_1100203 [Chytriomyces sp. MP71]|nr:hypothetical protein BC830DRAFT_1100203 [Chytriomyces sp. MP71]
MSASSTAASVTGAITSAPQVKSSSVIKGPGGGAVVPVRPSATTTDANGNPALPATTTDTNQQPQVPIQSDSSGNANGGNNGAPTNAATLTKLPPGGAVIPSLIAPVSKAGGSSGKPVAPVSGSTSAGASSDPSAASANNSSGGSPIAMIAGVAGGVTILLILAAAAFVLLRTRRSRRNQNVKAGNDLEMRMGYERSNRYVHKGTFPAEEPGDDPRGRRLGTPVNARYLDGDSRGASRGGGGSQQVAGERWERDEGAHKKAGYSHKEERNWEQRDDRGGSRDVNRERRNGGRGGVNGPVSQRDQYTRGKRDNGRGDERVYQVRSENTRDRRSLASLNSSRDGSPDRVEKYKKERRNPEVGNRGYGGGSGKQQPKYRNRDSLDSY